MKTATRQSVGIDIGKDSFVACVSRQYADGTLGFGKVENFENTRRGFNQLVKWVRKQCDASTATTYLMEATGIYYEPLAYHLDKLGQTVVVVLPNKVKHFGKSLNIKSKTDAIDAKIIAQMGVERTFDAWRPPKAIYKELRALTRIVADLKKRRTVFSNQLHSLNAGHEPVAVVRKSLNDIIKTIDKEIVKMEKAIRQLVGRDVEMKRKFEKLETVKGVGFITVATVVAETQGFHLIRNRKQLISYAGYDVVQRESGSSVKSKTKISKKGNAKIRAAMYFPALSASLHDPEFKAVYQRINQGKPVKLVGAVAIQRKLLALLYTLWKNDTCYRPPSERDGNISGDYETEPLLRPEGEAPEGVMGEFAFEYEPEITGTKVGKPTGLPTQDGLPSDQSTGALLRQ